MRDLLAPDRPTIALLAERLKPANSHPECQRSGLSARLAAIESDLSRIQELVQLQVDHCQFIERKFVSDTHRRLVTHRVPNQAEHKAFRIAIPRAKPRNLVVIRGP